MSGGGGGGSSTTTTQIPDEMKPLANDFVRRATALSDTATPYTGQRFAGLTGAQEQGLGMIENRAMQGSQLQQGAESALGGFFNPQGNPYLDSMVNRAQGNVLGNANQAAARSGSFGNSGIAEQAGKQMGEIATSMYGNAYAGDRANALQAIGMAPGLSAAGYNDANQLLRAGQLRQDQAQQGMDFNFQQFQEQQNQPYKTLAAQAGVVGAQPFGSSSTSTQSGGGK